MLLSLPVELVERIVRLALPDEMTSTTYGERQATLRACCLVSSGMRAVAQPILEEACWIRHDRSIGWDEAQQTLSRISKCLRSLWVQEHWEEKADDFAAFLPLCKRLRELRLCGWRAFSLCTLKDLPVLRRLGLCDLCLDSPSCALPQVEELSLWCLNALGKDQQSILTPETFPSLRHLTFYGDMAGSPFPVPSLVSSLISITVNEFDIVHDPAAYEHPSTPRLVRVYHDYLDPGTWFSLCSNAEHVQLLRGLDWPESLSNDILEDLAEDLENHSAIPSIRLRLIYLPSAYSACVCGVCQQCNNHGRFQRACAARGIAVDSEDYDDEYGARDVSRKFAAYAEQKKRQREEEEIRAGEELAV
ncbi:hypothetical protein JCM10213_002994 [Rhodosporidiobolus nylandii]